MSGGDQILDRNSNRPGNGWSEESVALHELDDLCEIFPKKPRIRRTLTLSRKLALLIKSVTRGESSVIFVVFSLHFSPNRIR